MVSGTGAIVVIESSAKQFNGNDLQEWRQNGLILVGLNRQFRVIPKIVSGPDNIVPGSLDRITRLRTEVADTIVLVSRTEIPEMSKLCEKCQRMLCLAYANEMVDACIPYDILQRTRGSVLTATVSNQSALSFLIRLIPYSASRDREDTMLPTMIAKHALISLLGDPLPKCAGVRPRILVAGIGFKRGQSNRVNSPGFEVMLADELVELNEGCDRSICFVVKHGVVRL
ncbi:hypothetical protein BJ875DRAFT_445460 [Amylocarpus encephaloides]|uniref:Uncharacterized protein n=1 Tax=Amylocarpus encephaloides TaxID=45428 RepID=A0A9P7YAA7_9HELO|nr:hypothetical protein BJ875DRAFT_445460 [Amylocarpus encephaloides]